MRAGCFVIKHAVAGGLVITAAALLAGVSWLGLFLWALAAGSPLGGPLALPFMMAGAIVGAALSVVVVLFPVTSATEVLRARWLKWPLWTEVPIAAVLLPAAAVLVTAIAAPILGFPRSQTITRAAVATLALLLPLGAYWCSTQATDAVLRMAQWAWRRIVGGSRAARYSSRQANPALQPPPESRRG